jgi:predicted unusual protein kinase regulating ubiquinone biosynthesis (AarF/ABC1/UbiB family)
MPNSKSQNSASDSPHEPTYRLVDATPNGHNLFTNGVALEEHSTTMNGNRPDPVVEPDFLKTTEWVTAPPDLSQVPSPAQSTVQESHGRSLRMQWRFMRTLFFAGWVFARILFWQVYAVRYFPAYVRGTEMARFRKYAREFRRFAVNLGGVYIKLGQFISTRVDVLPEEIIEILSTLQDEVPSVDFKKIEKVLLEELGPSQERFEWINRAPVAAASLGQVHRARLKSGERVVVKAQRPGIRQLCYTDLAAMRVVARVAMRFNFISDRADANALVDEFGVVLLEELSYHHEAHNATRFAHMFKDDMGVYIPEVYYEHSTDRVLTMEDVTTVKITDFEAIDRAGISRKEVANRLMDTYMVQIFDEYFFHADPHPGNLFVYPLPVEDENADFGPKGRPFYLIFIDFGMTGSLKREIADGMVSTLHAVLTRDVVRMVENYERLGFLRPNANKRRIVEAMSAAFDQVWGLSISDLRNVDYGKMAEIGGEFNDLLFSMPVYIPQDFIYLGRTLSILSGMATSLDPNYNPWKEMQPYVETLIARGFGADIPQGQKAERQDLIRTLVNGEGTKVLRNIGEQAVRRTLGPVVDPVFRADDALKSLQSGNIHVIADLSTTHRQQLRRLERESRRTGRSIFFGSMLVSSTLMFTSGYEWIGATGWAFCGLIVLFGELRE